MPSIRRENRHLFTRRDRPRLRLQRAVEEFVERLVVERRLRELIHIDLVLRNEGQDAKRTFRLPHLMPVKLRENRAPREQPDEEAPAGVLIREAEPALAEHAFLLHGFLV